MAPGAALVITLGNQGIVKRLAPGRIRPKDYSGDGGRDPGNTLSIGPGPAKTRGSFVRLCPNPGSTLAARLGTKETQAALLGAHPARPAHTLPSCGPGEF